VSITIPLPNIQLQINTMSSPPATPSTESSGNTNPGLSTHALVGLVVGPLFFIFTLATFWLVSRKRQMPCFRRNDVEAQRKQERVDQFMARLSSANASRSRREDLAGMDMREVSGPFPELTRQGTYLPDPVPQPPAVSASPSVPRPVYNPSPRVVVSQITLVQ